MNIWFIIFMIVNSDGSVNATIRYPLQPQYNTEASCNETGQILADEEQLKIGSNNGTIFWRCEPIPFNDIKKLVPNSDL